MAIELIFAILAAVQNIFYATTAKVFSAIRK